MLYKSFQFAQQNKNQDELTKLLEEIKKREKEFTSVSIDYMKLLPWYFNSGCCCYSDGDITGIEIDGGNIQLIKWCLKDGVPTRHLLEQTTLAELI